MDADAVAGARPARHVSVPAGARIFRGRYLSITSYRRDGTGVATPVWFVQEDGLLLAQTDPASGKAKRIRRNPRVTVAVCSASGRLRGTPVTGRAWLLPGTQTARVERLLARKYRFDLLIIKPLRAAQAALHRGRPRTGSVIIAVRPD
jgi:uncharacterized protein